MPQVLQKALEIWGLTVAPLRTFDCDPGSECAFICHMQHHWFTVRKISDGQWYNFNSLLPAPTPLSPLYLGMFISSLLQEGYTVFTVRGKLPDNMMSLSELPRQARLLTPDEVVMCCMHRILHTSSRRHVS